MKNIGEKAFFSAPEVAKILGISRVAVFNRIKSGKMKAEKVGRNYLISREEIFYCLKDGELTEERKKIIDQNIDLIMKEYGEAIRMLGKE